MIIERHIPLLIIYRMLACISCAVVYYRECDGPCDCRKVYDGQLDFVLNVGNEFIIEHGVLLTHLHQMLEGHASLATLYR